MDDYERISQMGDGAQGRVFRVRHRKHSKEYAMKVMQCDGQGQMNSALKEIKVLIEIRHPNIVSYTDFFLELCDQNGGRCSNPGSSNRGPGISVCLVMELCQNGDLHERISEAKRAFILSGRNPFEERIVRRWIAECAEALQFIHAKGFLHRDLKPTNIFFSGTDNLKLGDFGLATNVGLGRRSAVGTPCYLAPELMLRLKYDERVDIWGLGVVFLELMTLRERPINSEVLSDPGSVDSVVFDIVDMGYSEMLAYLVHEMLQRSPEARPTTGEILRRLQSEALPEAVPKSISGTVEEPRPLRTSSRARMCEMCQETTGVIYCPTCQEFFCRSCDASHHRVNDRRGHQRFPATPSDKGHDDRAVKCQMCEAFAAVVCCPTCSNEYYCRACDEVKHKNLRRQGHNRVPIDAIRLGTGTTLFREGPGEQRHAGRHLQPQPPDPNVPPQRMPQQDDLPRARRTVAVPTQGIPPRKPFVPHPANAASNADGAQRQADCAPRSSSPPLPSLPSHQVIRVPSQYPTIAAAIDAAPNATRILVAGGGTYTEELLIKAKNIQLVGEEPRPRIIVSGTVAVHLESEGGLLQHFEIVQDRGLSRGKEVRPFGIEIVSGQWRVHDCVIRSVTGNCIGICGDADPVISKCVIKEGHQGGVFAFDGGKGLIQDNQFLNCGYAALLLKRQANPRIIGNVIVGGEETGIFCRDSFGVMENNVITKNRGCGIVVKGDARPIIRRNQISYNSQAGIYCCDGAQGVISDNEVLHNVKAGLLIKTMANPTIVRNKLCHGKETGVYVFEKGEGVIEDNEIMHNTNAGILITTGGNPTVKNNRITKNLYEGVWVCKNGKGQFSQNDLRGNAKGAKDIDASSTSCVWDGSNIES